MRANLIGFQSLALLLMTVLNGCLSPIALKHAVLAYDKTVAESSTEQLLLNIGRARHHHPLHFTGVSNIAATFNFQAQAGATPPLGGLTGGTALSPIFGASMSENPTISIFPIEGEAFTQRLLTPLDETKFHFLLRRGVNVGILLRLVCREIHLISPSAEAYLLNEPEHQVPYENFRRHISHLASLDERHQLFVGPVIYPRTWNIALDPEDALEAIEKGYDVEFHSESKKTRLTKTLIGRVVITNFDPDTLPPEERKQLHVLAKKLPRNEILVDIRPGHPGGDFPIHGTLQLRGFASILDFLARGISAAPEYDVALDPRTPSLNKNPAKTLEVLELETQPDTATFSVAYNGGFYALRETEDGWNREAFRLLYQIFQMTVTDVPPPIVPSITIAK